MGKSFRKTPIAGMTCRGHKMGEKRDKQFANRRLRAAERSWLAASTDTPAPLLREVSEVYCFAKDGKQYLGDRHPEMLRK
ncbi:hypothetical protein MHM84_03685 [Halomonas sp. McH1-25]|uniref:hypothetical protein n=1 Tax=unclassified Halomonas TaxID=2609666 RepID=UPI001EF6A6E6|nr:MULTISPECIES: hypothetical protein [unclassified Halomonas]MCG7598874.1 hypothetical protein [Halomonas sp. McH1-25]MCP1340837.1 hypothetical protein [Halomonas sp. FL8]MCP1361280.1 hypothetical protein [Halomonas sp. BBD45]MCP1363693.1 hypothetical protein [Halomonas sp. BBD48]